MPPPSSARPPCGPRRVDAPWLPVGTESLPHGHRAELFEHAVRVVGQAGCAGRAELGEIPVGERERQGIRRLELFDGPRSKQHRGHAGPRQQPGDRVESRVYLPVSQPPPSGRHDGGCAWAAGSADLDPERHRSECEAGHDRSTRAELGGGHGGVWVGQATSKHPGVHSRSIEDHRDTVASAIGELEIALRALDAKHPRPRLQRLVTGGSPTPPGGMPSRRRAPLPGCRRGPPP